MKKSYTVTILRPGGNDTALVEGIVKKEKKKVINNIIMEKYPTVEQVGFYWYNSNIKYAQLDMAGGEFCGNALRSLAFLLLQGNQGEIQCKVSGSTRLLKAGVKQSNNAYAQMPIIQNATNTKKINNNLWQVDLEGISHLILPYSKLVNPEEAKKIAYILLNKTKLTINKSAAGVMFVRQANSILQIEPVVWVKNIQTLFYETACASGTTAVALWMSSKQMKNIVTISAKQPSGAILKVTIKKPSQEAIISGPVTFLKKEVLCLER